MRIKKFIIIAILSFVVIFVASGIILTINTRAQVKTLFRLNKKLQKEGYYMAEFEFRLLGFAYMLDKGHYLQALHALSEYCSKLKNKNGLVKIPKFSCKQEEIDFFLSLQNPKTGAFMDESVPYCTYLEITQNILNHLEALRDSTTAPLKLKYPLKFLDEINTPEKLTKFLDDISYVGWIASKFPQTTFHFARNTLDCAKSGNIFERNKLYNFSPEWKHAMLKWMCDFQDSATGLWGPKKRRTHKLLKYDLNNTASIVKAFRDNDGNNLYPEFPLRYADKIFPTTLNILSEKYPANEDLDEIHEWNLKQVKGFNMLLRYLWKDASNRHKKALEQIIENFIKLSFDKYYVKSEGAFSYYPNSKHASADGYSNMIFSDIGAFSYNKQRKLFSVTQDSVKDLGSVPVKDLKPFLQKTTKNDFKINSVRFYQMKPEITNLTGNAWAVYYPANSRVLDVTELVPKLITWADSTTLTIGNWTSVSEIKKELEKLDVKKPTVLQENTFESSFTANDEIYCVGFNVLQLPKFIIKVDLRCDYH